jgi:tetratricopeptide (TPR) repeat protein
MFAGMPAWTPANRLVPRGALLAAGRPKDIDMKNMILAAVLALVPAAVFAQDVAQLQRLFEAGRYQQVVDAAAPDAEPAVTYTAAQSLQKLGATDQAREAYGRLSSLPEGDAWHWIGLSAEALLDGNNDAALDAARRAADTAPDSAEARFQLGLVQARRQDWGDAAEAFDRAAELNPSNAYAHYYGGLMHYRANRTDRMAIHFEQFLKLAPEAPERPEVLQIMKTIRGR